jgi:high-affinity iron transporter
VLATYVIGLREGLEAALIVGILATFLKRNGASLRPMWIGTTAAVVLSILVGVALEVVSASLPQQAQEGMESIISAVAVVFVTTMIVWMSSHARGLKKELEEHAASALRTGTVWAVAAMAFLAVLREGFETSVFLLATFQASSNVVTAVAGAVLGILTAVVLGVGIYHGGVRFNLGKFFTVTGVFLVFVAAGLVVTTLRTAHEAGWLVVGQARTIDLSWLAPPGSIRAAIVTGVLGIPPDPRVIELLAWLCYLVPMLVLVLWPASRRLSGRAVPRLQLGLAAGLGVVAVALFTLLPAVPAYTSTDPAPLVTADGSAAGDATLSGAAPDLTLVVGGTDGAETTVPLSDATWTTGQHSGVEARTTTWSVDTAADQARAQVTLTDLLHYEGGRLPVGVNAAAHPGPFDATWQRDSHGEVWVVGDTLLDATHAETAVLTISGGGLPTPRTFTVDPTVLGDGGSWTTAPEYVTAVAKNTRAAADADEERALWNRMLPAALLIAALVLAAYGLRGRRRLARETSEPPPTTTTTTTATTTGSSQTRDSSRSTIDAS